MYMKFFRLQAQRNENNFQITVLSCKLIGKKSIENEK